MYKCPMCGRDVGMSQRTCLCGAVLRADDEPSSAERFDYGMLLPWIPLVASLLVVFWILPLDYSHHPGTKLIKLTGVMIILSALFSCLDADRLSGQTPADPRLEFPAPVWFLMQILAWPVAFPLYLYASYKRFRPWRMQFGWATAGLFVLFALLAWARRDTMPTMPAQAAKSAGSPARPLPPASVQPTATPGNPTVVTAALSPAVLEPTVPPPVVTLPPPPGSTPVPTVTPVITPAPGPIARNTDSRAGSPPPPSFGVQVAPSRGKHR